MNEQPTATLAQFGVLWGLTLESWPENWRRPPRDGIWNFSRRHLAVQFAARRGIRIEPNQESR